MSVQESVFESLHVLWENEDEILDLVSKFSMAVKGLHPSSAVKMAEAQIYSQILSAQGPEAAKPLALLTPDQRKARRQAIFGALANLYQHSGEVASVVGSILTAIPATSQIGVIVSGVAGQLPKSAG